MSFRDTSLQIGLKASRLNDLTKGRIALITKLQLPLDKIYINYKCNTRLQDHMTKCPQVSKGRVAASQAVSPSKLLLEVTHHFGVTQCLPDFTMLGEKHSNSSIASVHIKCANCDFDLSNIKLAN